LKHCDGGQRRQVEVVDHPQTCERHDTGDQYRRERVDQRTEKTDEAIASFEKALQLNPDSAETHAKLAGALVKSQLLEKAAKHCEQALKLARLQGLTELAKQMEAWLTSYRSMRSRETRPPDPSPLPR
jgi:tetratricopeptide (TPR) repeat protein